VAMRCFLQEKGGEITWRHCQRKGRNPHLHPSSRSWAQRPRHLPDAQGYER
jgi:hypothetical protein